MRYFCGVFEGSEDFDSIYGIGVLMQSLWENYHWFAPICHNSFQSAFILWNPSF